MCWETCRLSAELAAAKMWHPIWAHEEFHGCFSLPRIPSSSLSSPRSESSGEGTPLSMSQALLTSGITVVSGETFPSVDISTTRMSLPSLSPFWNEWECGMQFQQFLLPVLGRNSCDWVIWRMRERANKGVERKRVPSRQILAPRIPCCRPKQYGRCCWGVREVERLHCLIPCAVSRILFSLKD
jgi:hypothetical protein